MHIINNIKNYLYDKNYIINIYDNSLYVFNYLKLKRLTDKEITLAFNGFDLEIYGNKFLVCQMTSRELLINGSIENMRFVYAKHI